MASLTVSDVSDGVESDYDGEVQLEVGGNIGSRYDRIFGKYVKGGVDVRIC